MLHIAANKLAFLFRFGTVALVSAEVLCLHLIPLFLENKSSRVSDWGDKAPFPTAMARLSVLLGLLI